MRRTLGSPVERAWLHHEMGRANFELERYPEARDHAKQAHKAAEAAQDPLWQLNACVLIAQTHGL